MKPLRDRSLAVFLAVLAVLTAGYLAGLAGVPFHPDESTQLFMSADVERIWQDPGDLFWQPEAEGNPVQRYHELDAPLTRMVIGLARQLAGLPALPVDWDWAKSWTENQQAGALPGGRLLLTARLAVGLFFPFSVLLLFLTARRAANNFTAWAAALMLAGNALILLHTRRAMAEGLLVFSLTLMLWCLVRCEKRPWQTALPAALAFCAKQSLLGLAPAGLLALLWPPYSQSEARPPQARQAARAFLQIGQFTVLFGLVIFLLNPFLWQQPWQAALAAIRARQQLSAAQVGDRPGQTLYTPGLRLVGLIGGLYLTPPIFHEVGNYAAETRAAEEHYLSNPLHALFRSAPGGGLLLLIGLLGFGAGCRAAMTGKDHSERRRLGLLVAATLFQAGLLLLTIALPWQRYYLPLVPLACLWQAYGLDQIRAALARAFQQSHPQAADHRAV